MVSEEKGLPEKFEPATGQNVLWRAKLGTESHGTPIVAGGRVYVGTNNEVPRDPKLNGDRGVLMAFSEKDGSFLWQLAVPKIATDQYLDWPKTGLASPPTVEGDRVYVVTNRGEVLCLDAAGMANGNDGPYRDEAKHNALDGAEPVEGGAQDADILWRLDMVADAGIWTHDGAHSSILIHGDFLYVNTGTGVDNTHRKIRTPEALSLIVIEKATGRLVARDDERIAPNIFHATWSSPSFGVVDGVPMIFFCGGNGIVRAFSPIIKAPPAGEIARLSRIWAYDPDPNAPKSEVHRFTQNRAVGPSDIYGMPVLVGNRLFIAAGGDIWWEKTRRG
jgi:outer membrane protein assembly factor BamB